MALKIIASMCTGCSACEPECPNDAISMGEDYYEIDPHRCTECVGHFDQPQCQQVCPVDCILKVQQYDQFHNLQSWCEIDIERCVGCEVCVHIPGKKSNPYELKVCPWDAIEMIPTEEVAQVVAQIGGPPEYVEQNWDRLVGTAQHLAELKAQAG